MALIVFHAKSQVSPHADRPKADMIRSRGGSAFAYQFGQGQDPTKANTAGFKRSPQSQHILTAEKHASVEQWTFFPSSIGLANTGPGLASLFDSSNIAWLTPSTTASLSSTPGSFSDTWDEPKTPCRSSSRTSANNFLTCFTPPTPPSVSLGIGSAAKVAALKTLGTPTTFDSLSNDENKTRLDDDEFRPQKIFRNLTQEFEVISNANIATAKTKFCLKPSLTFSFEDSKPISSRTRSKASSVCNRQVPENDTQERPFSRGSEKTRKPYNELERLLERILPWSVQARLRMSPCCCAASTGNDLSKRCAYKSKGHGNPSHREFEKLVACKEKGHYDSMIRCIERLVQTTMCGTHQNVALKQPQAGARIDQLRKLLVGFTGVLSDDLPEIFHWIDAISDPDASTEHVEPPSVSSTPSSHVNASVKVAPRPSTKPNETVQKVQVSYSLQFSAFLKRDTMYLSVAKALQQEIRKPLGQGDHSKGFIYMFWDKQHFGMLKIGFTNNLKDRLKRWNRQCGRTHSYLSMDDRSEEDMPHVRRVERLIHTELKDCREQRQCEGCGKTHIEWFRENEVHAVKVARKWQEWIMQEPYMFDKKTKLWVLKPEIFDTLEDVCKPVPRKEAALKSQCRNVGVKGALKKTGARKKM